VVLYQLYTVIVEQAKLECREESFTLLERYEEAMGYKKEANLCLGLPG
jgi:hypothetical protein